MNNLLKYFLFGLAGLIVLLGIALAVFAATFNPNDYKPMVVKLVQDKKQRTLHIEGDIKLAFWPKLGADLGKISLSEHNSDKEFAAVDGLQVSLALLPLLRKQLVVDTIYIDGARANIVRYQDGSTNFDDLLSEDDEPSQIQFDVDGIVASNSSLKFTDERAGKDYSVSKLNLKTGHVVLGAPFDLATDFAVAASDPRLNLDVALKGNFLADPEAKHYIARQLDTLIKGDLAGGSDVVIKLAGDVDARPENMEFVVDGLKLAVEGKFEAGLINAELLAPKLVVQQDQVSGKEVEIQLTQEKGNDKLKASLVLADLKGSPKAVQSSGISGDLSGRQGARSIQGKFSSPFTGNLEQLVFDLPKLAGSLDIRDPALPSGKMAGTFALRLHTDLKNERVASDFNLDIDNTKLKGDMKLASFSRPAIKFNLNADSLDLNKLLGKKPAAAGAKKTAARADQPADLSALKNLLLEGKVSIGSILYDKYKLTGMNLGIKADGEKLHVSPLAVKFDDSQIKGAFGISRFANPIYHFDLDIDRLDADRYITPTDNKTASGKEAPADPNAPIDLSALKSLNANGELRLGWLKLANVTSTNVRIKLKADDGVAELAPFSANLYQGAMNGTLRVDARSTPNIAFRQDMHNINIGPLLVDAINNDMLSGKGTLKVDVTTQGSTVAALKKGLNGKAAVNLADGAVKGIDIAGTLRDAKDRLNVLKSQTSIAARDDKKTDFSEMVASFNIRNGVAHNDDLSMKAPLLRITGSGDIDLAHETIQYLAKPTVVRTLKGQGGAGLEELNGLTVPVKLSGTFAKPTYSIDFAGLATALAQQKALEGIGGEKGDAVRSLIGGNKEDALKSILGGNKKTDADTTDTDDSATQQPASEPATASPEEKAKEKLRGILGF